MNIYQLRDNLKIKIKNERELLAKMSEEDSSDYSAARYLAINIDDLERILVDVEICCDQATLNNNVGK